MPLYEYRCRACGSRFELLRPMSKANEDAPCLSCGGTGYRVVSLFAAFSTGEGGETASVAGTGGCASCAGGTCSHCSHH